MKIEKSELIRRIVMLEKVVLPKCAIKCMEGILVHNGRMIANDLTSAITISTPEAENEHFILSKKAIDMLKNLPEGLVQIQSFPDHSLIMSSDRVRSKMLSMDPDGFTEPPVIEVSTETTMDFGSLCEMLSEVSYCTAETSSRPVHTGILLESDGEKLNAVASDGFRLAWAQTDYKQDFKMVIPKQVAKLLLSIKTDSDQISIKQKGHKAVFQVGDIQIYSNLLDGAFVNYKQLVPQRTKSVGADRRALLEAMRRVSICADDPKRVGVEVMGMDDKLQFKFDGSQTAYTEELTLMDNFDTEIKVKFNAAYLIDAVKSYDCETIDLYFGETNAEPLVINDGQLKSLVLPVRMQ